MQNPLASLTHPAVPPGTFRRAFLSGAGNGALMMGIFNTIALVGHLVFPLAIPFTFGTALVMMGLGITTTGLFSGIMAGKRHVDEYHSAARHSQPAERRDFTPAMAVEPELAAAPEPAQSSWTGRVDRPAGGRDTIATIIADRGLSDKDRASAILRERELSSALENAR